MMDSQTKRLQSDEEIMADALDKRGRLDLRISFAVKDARGIWRPLRRRNISVTKIPNQGRLFQILNDIWLTLSK